MNSRIRQEKGGSQGRSNEAREGGNVGWGEIQGGVVRGKWGRVRMDRTGGRGGREMCKKSHVNRMTSLKTNQLNIAI